MKRPHYQKRHYVQLARLVASLREDTLTSYMFCRELETRLIAIFAPDNPLFDSARFTAACRKDKTE